MIGVPNEAMTSRAEDGMAVEAPGTQPPRYESFLAVIAVLLKQSLVGNKAYVSTMNLQVASMDLCISCREYSRIHVRVENGTPPSLYAPTLELPLCMTSDLYSTTKRVRSKNRIPAIHALTVSWGMSSRLLSLQNSRLVSAEYLLFRSCFDGSLDNVVWSEKLKCVRFEPGSRFNQSIKRVTWPASLQDLSFADLFNQPIDEVAWPASLQTLAFNGWFNHPVCRGVTWPSSLRELKFGHAFNQPIDEVKWPASLQLLDLGWVFNQHIDKVTWPQSLKWLALGDEFNRPVDSVVWPASLQQLSFGQNFNQPLERVVWPTTLKELTFGYDFNQPIDRVVWPESLQRLRFGEEFDQPIDRVVWPTSLRKVTFGEAFTQDLSTAMWPTSLQLIERRTGNVVVHHPVPDRNAAS